MSQSTIQLYNLAPLMGGLAGGSASTIILYPLDLIKVRMQVNEEPQQRLIQTFFSSHGNKKRKSVLGNMREIIRKEGPLGLYQGLSPALIGSAVSWGGYFYIYERMKRILIQRNNSKGIHDKSIALTLGPLENFTAACVAGTALVLITNPIWLIKTRMQLQTREKINQKPKSILQFKQTSTSQKYNNNNRPINELLRNKKAYDGILDAAQTIIREEGPMALYKGAIPALMLVSHGGVQFVSYEFLKERFGVYSRARRKTKHRGGIYTSQEELSLTLFEQLQNSVGYLTMGAVSKIIASTVTYPLQVIKSRLQKRSPSLDPSISTSSNITDLKQTTLSKNISTNLTYVKDSHPNAYFGVLDCTKRIWMNEGVHGFFKGCVPNALRVAPSAAITFVVYEGIVDLIT